MQFEKERLYHIYNQGNNRQKIFYKRDNYLFFLQKIRTHILPYADIVSWCLMPNHFHLMVYIKRLSVPITPQKERTLNNSIAIMLRSYTRALNKQQNRSGSLFRNHTKAVCVNCLSGVTSSFIGNRINMVASEKQYPQVCFDYIHQNPVKAKLATTPTDWEFSSAIDYTKSRKGTLINQNVAKMFQLY